MAKKKSSGRKKPRETPSMTATQGQYLAFIYLCRKLHRYSPSESEIGQYFGVSPPSVHQMIVKLEEKGLITREPGVPRSIRPAVPRSEIPNLADDAEDRALEVEASRRTPTGPTRLYTLEVFLIGGPMPEDFGGKSISRTIQIRGDQTLEDLHQAIFEAYDRFDEHFYEFQFGKGPHDPKGTRYVLPEALADMGHGPTLGGTVTQTTLDSLELEVGQAFGYWFDFGDDWWHQINVEAIDEKVPRGRFPRVTKRVGKSPPQYMDEDE